MRDHFPVHVFQQFILSWYEKNKRDLPWRKLDAREKRHTPSQRGEHKSRQIRDPYRILVSELMLQQTQVTRVRPKFQRFIERWPTIDDLAQATLSEVITEWQGLGYNRRAKHLLETVKIVIHTYHGIFPHDTNTLQKLPGFGPYMVSALRVFSFGEQDAVIDVNIARVLTRIENGKLKIENKKEIQEVAEQSIPKGKADEWHQALMDFGAVICTARKPRCEDCPVSRICRANKQAKDQGFASYADWLILQPKVKSNSGKDAGKKFEETDRYFRGRIIDYLRSGEKPMVDVQRYILLDHKLVDRKRFGVIVESLMIDGLITVQGNTVSLA